MVRKLKGPRSANFHDFISTEKTEDTEARRSPLHGTCTIERRIAFKKSKETLDSTGITLFAFLKCNPFLYRC